MVRCYGDVYVNVFLIADGVLSVFLFPINVMEWTRHVVGCVATADRDTGGMIYVVILITRTGAAALGAYTMFKVSLSVVSVCLHAYIQILEHSVICVCIVFFICIVRIVSKL